jgi:diguanylate cyclase (GGDEF)-like protein
MEIMRPGSAPSWLKTVETLAHRVGMDSIKTKLLVFALLATLLPSLALGWRSYTLNQAFVTEKIAGDLRTNTGQTAREIDLWLKERLYEMRVFSSSYEVTENLQKLEGGRRTAARPAEPRRRLAQFLGSVRAKFSDYDELLVVNPSGTVLVSTAERPGALPLPPDWLKLARADRPILGEAHWDRARGKAVLAIGVPITAVDGALLGVLAGTVNFGTVERMLARLDPGPEGHAYLVRRDGTVLVSPRPEAAARLSTRVEAVPALFDTVGASVEYADYRGRAVVGQVAPVSLMRWGVAAEVGRQAAYATIAHMRNVTLALIGSVLVGIGLTAYLLALTIVQPLNRLTAAAARVAADDLEIDLPVVSRGEVGYLTAVFNRMVSRLRHGRDELHKLSITDPLTGLYNRRHLMETLVLELERARELYPVSVLMIDIDHFKQYNDSRGHLAGDALLVWVAAQFKGAIRDDDYAARYGGDEFLVLLRATSHSEAVPVAERLQAHVRQAGPSGGHEGVTVSIGVASFPTHGQTPEAVIARADAALYEAKKTGRNRIALASGRPASRVTR